MYAIINIITLISKL